MTDQPTQRFTDLAADRPVALDTPLDTAHDAPGTVDTPGEPTTIQYILEYLTFGHSVHYLLKVLVLQFAVLFLDIDVVTYTASDIPAGRQHVVAPLFLGAALLFLGMLVVLVRRMGRRTLAPRFHTRRHIAAAVLAYLAASGLAYGLGYLVIIWPSNPTDPTIPELVPGGLLVFVFAAFIAVGYHGQVDDADHPRAGDITDEVAAWLDTLDWVEEPPHSLARANAYREFVTRTDELATMLTESRTYEGRRLGAEFHAFRATLACHSMLSREMVIRGTVADGTLQSERLTREHEAFDELRDDLATIAGVDA